MIMQTPSVHSQDTDIFALYDGKCPLCQFGVKNYQLDRQYGELNVVDIREETALKKEAQAQGFDLDRNVVVKHGDQFYDGGDALHYMAMRADKRGWLGRILPVVFRSRVMSRLLYPLLRNTRRVLLWLRHVPTIKEEDAPRKESAIKRQLSAADWKALHPDVQRRFATEPALYDQVIYRGVMERVECSAAGKIFAYFTRLIANPLTPHRGVNVPMDVLLYRKVGEAGTYWRRTYYYPGKTPYTVTSVKRAAKRENAKEQMTECVGAGFGMVLAIAQKNGTLHFTSTRYFWQMGPLYIALPHLLTPGQTHVIHEPVNDTQFRFTITMTHPWLGQTFYQTGIFTESNHEQ